MAISDAFDRLASETRPVSSPSLILSAPASSPASPVPTSADTSDEAERIVLPLRVSPAAPDADALFAPPVQVRSLSDYVVRFDPEAALSAAFPGAQVSADRASFNLLLNGEIVPTAFCRSGAGADGRRIFALAPMRGFGLSERRFKLFSSAAGCAALSLRIIAAEGECVLHADPVVVVIPEGYLAENLAAMARFVADRYESLLAVSKSENETSALAADRLNHAGGDPLAMRDPLLDRTAVLEKILGVFERELPYFRTNARFRFIQSESVVPLARAHVPAKSAPAYLSAHPEVFTAAPSGGGIVVGGRRVLPRRIPVAAALKAGDTYENLAAAAFLSCAADSLDRQRTLAAEVRSRLESMKAPEGFASPAAPLFAARARRIHALEARLEKLAALFRLLFLQYRKAFGLTEFARALADAAKASCRLPRKTAVFRSIASYRRIYEAMARWFSLDEIAFEKEKELSAFLSRSRFYEVFALMKILDGLERRGFRLVRKARFDYAAALPAGLLQTTSAGLTCANTFHFERAIDGENQARVTVYYEPLIRMAGEAPLNGLGLCRTSAFSYDASTNSLVPLNHAAADRAVYTPDIVIAAHDGNRCRWFIADAKYASVETAAAQEALPLAFKYLMSVSPIRPADETAGLWLLCGKRSPGDDPDEAAGCLNAFGAAMGVAGRADVHFEPLAGSSDSDSPSNLVEAVCAAFRGF